MDEGYRTCVAGFTDGTPDVSSGNSDPLCRQLLQRAAPARPPRDSKANKTGAKRTVSSRGRVHRECVAVASENNTYDLEPARLTVNSLVRHYPDRMRNAIAQSHGFRAPRTSLCQPVGTPHGPPRFIDPLHRRLRSRTTAELGLSSS